MQIVSLGECPRIVIFSQIEEHDKELRKKGILGQAPKDQNILAALQHIKEWKV